MKKMTFAQLRQINPYKAGQLMTALNNNRVDTTTTKKRNILPKNFREDLTKYILTKWKN